MAGIYPKLRGFHFVRTVLGIYRIPTIFQIVRARQVSPKRNINSSFILENLHFFDVYIYRRKNGVANIFIIIL